MSTSVSYFSFSPARADEGWRFFAEDLRGLREFARARKRDEAAYAARQGEATAAVGAELEKKRTAIFKEFEDDGYFIPGIGWHEQTGVGQDGTPFGMTDEEKMDYLLNYGMLYQRGVWPDEKQTQPFRMLYLGAKDEYVQLRRQRQQLARTIERVRTPAKLTARQEALFHRGRIEALLGEPPAEVPAALVAADLFYGGAEWDGFDALASEPAILEQLVKAFGMENENGVPTRSGWLALFSDLSPEKIQAALRGLAAQSGKRPADAGALLKQYLKAVHVVARDLKEQPDSQFVRRVDAAAVQPEQAARLLAQRAAAHEQEFSQVLGS